MGAPDLCGGAGDAEDRCEAAAQRRCGRCRGKLYSHNDRQQLLLLRIRSKIKALYLRTDTSVTARRKKGPHRFGAGLASLYAFCCAERRHFVFSVAVYGKTLHRKAFEEPRRRPVFSRIARTGVPSRKKIPRPARDRRGERHGISGGETAQSGIPAKNRRGDSTEHCIF